MSSENGFLKTYAPIFAMAGIILAVQLVALLLAQPMNAKGMQAFEDPDSTVNSLFYIMIILIFTFFLLIALKKNMQKFIKLVILLAVASTVYYVSTALMLLITDSGILIYVISLSLTIVLTVLLYKFPEWYVINTIGLIIGAGASAIFGISLSIIPVIVLLLLLAVYDAISVYKTKHMIDLAEGVMDLRLPILFIIPKKLNYSFLKDNFKKEEGEERDAFFMGLGDAVMPTILVVSSNIFLAKYSPLQYMGISYPTIGAMIGTFTGYAILMIFVMKGKPQAGLPFLNAGAILGYVTGVLISGVPFY